MFLYLRSFTEDSVPPAVSKVRRYRSVSLWMLGPCEMGGAESSRLDCLPRGNGGGRPGRCNRLAGGPGLLRDGGSRLLCRLGLRRWLCLLALLLGSSGLLGGLLHGRLGRCQDRLQDHTANDDHDRDHDCQESFPIHASLFPSLRGRDHTRRRERDGT